MHKGCLRDPDTNASLRQAECCNCGTPITLREIAQSLGWADLDPDTSFSYSEEDWALCSRCYCNENGCEHCLSRVKANGSAGASANQKPLK